MAIPCHLLVCFPASGIEDIQPLASDARTKLGTAPAETFDFLQYLADGLGLVSGPNGGLVTWGYTGDGTSPELFVESLLPFFADLLAPRDDSFGGPQRHEHVIVFYEHDSRGGAACFEVGWREWSGDQRFLNVQQHEDLPFRWNLF